MKLKITIIVTAISLCVNCLFLNNATAQMIAMGGYYSLAICSDSTAKAWGYNFHGQLGDSTTDDSWIPVQVKNLTRCTAIAGGYYHSLALKADGTVWAWGDNINGQLGNDTTLDSWIPIQVNDLAGITTIAAGWQHSLALKNDSTVWAWGYNFYGQLGDSTNTDRWAPVQVMGLTGITAIAGGSGHSLALKSDSTVWAWGANNSGQLGDGLFSVYEVVPVQVVNLTGVIAVAAGENHSLALKSDNTVWAWGSDNFSQLGDSGTNDRAVPMQVRDLAGIISIGGGVSHSLALGNNGIVWTFGDNTFDQCGDTLSFRPTPLPVNDISAVTAIAAGSGAYHSLAMKNDHSLWTWGDNFYGELGDSTSNQSYLPVQVTHSCSLPIGVEELPDELLLSVFPNPATGWIEVKSLKYKVKSLALYNLIGELVYQSEKNSSSNEMEYKIDLSSQPDGLYYLSAKTNEKNIFRKIVKQ